MGGVLRGALRAAELWGSRGTEDGNAGSGGNLHPIGRGLVTMGNRSAVNEWLSDVSKIAQLVASREVKAGAQKPFISCALMLLAIADGDAAIPKRSEVRTKLHAIQQAAEVILELLRWD